MLGLPHMTYKVGHNRQTILHHTTHLSTNYVETTGQSRYRQHFLKANAAHYSLYYETPALIYDAAGQTLGLKILIRKSPMGNTFWKYEDYTSLGALATHSPSFAMTYAYLIYAQLSSHRGILRV